MLLLVFLIFVFQAGAIQALSSRRCLELVERFQLAVDSGRATKCWPLCGSLDTDNHHLEFMDRLSPSCQAVMSRYKAAMSSLPAYLGPLARSDNLNRNKLFPSADTCSRFKQAGSATNPVVVELETSAPFVMCTVPKAGCTLLRSLLYVLTRRSQDSVFFKNGHVHDAQYSTALHYHHQSELPDTYPTFVVGRNPYIRLVSGFLDKMVVTQQSHDWVIMGRVNSDLGVPSKTVFRATKESFSEFVRLLNKTSNRNPHFDTAVNVCYMTKFPYRYMLRIEEMSEWYPCWSSGLRLDPFTQTGWNRSSHGHTSFNASGTSCWWAPAQNSCQEYDSMTHSDSGDAIVPENWKAATTTHAHDAHDTGAAERWRRFYDQQTADTVYAIYKQDFDAFRYERLVF